MRLVINPKFPFTRRMGLPIAFTGVFNLAHSSKYLRTNQMFDYALYALYGGAKWNDKFHELNGLYPLHSFEYFSYSLSIFPPILSHLRSATSTGTGWQKIPQFAFLWHCIQSFYSIRHPLSLDSHSPLLHTAYT